MNRAWYSFEGLLTTLGRQEVSHELDRQWVTSGLTLRQNPLGLSVLDHVLNVLVPGKAQLYEHLHSLRRLRWPGGPAEHLLQLDLLVIHLLRGLVVLAHLCYN